MTKKEVDMQEKLQALEAVRLQIDKQFGEGTIMFMGEKNNLVKAL